MTHIPSSVSMVKKVELSTAGTDPENIRARRDHMNIETGAKKIPSMDYIKTYFLRLNFAPQHLNNSLKLHFSQMAGTFFYRKLKFKVFTARERLLRLWTKPVQHTSLFWSPLLRLKKKNRACKRERERGS